jgi:hypothetical protein
MSKDFQALDTTVVQVRSVLNFMYALGYTLDEESNSGRFVTKNRSFKGNKHLSFSTAAKLHNLADENWIINTETGEVKPSCVELVNGFSAIGVRMAQASKLVKQVKLSLSKHGQVLTLDVMIVPLNKVVEGLIGL